MLQTPQQALPLFPGQVVDLLPSGNTGQLDDHRDQLLGQQIVQSVLEIVVGVFGKIRQQPLVQLLLIQRRLQVDLKPVALFGKMPHVGRGRQHQRTADAEVRKQQLAEIRIDLLIVFKDRQAHVPQHGKALSDAMADQGKVFPELLISMVRAGEASGKIGDTFINMGEHFQKQQRIKSQVKGALAYPLVLVILLVLVIIVMFTFILPMFGDMFTDMELPLMTRILMGMSDFLTHYWYVAIGVVAAIVVVFVMLMRTPASRLVIDRMIVHLPKIGNLVRIVYTASFSRTLASLYTSGLSILNALQISRDTVNNSYLRSQFDDCIKSIRVGNALSESIMAMDGFDSKLGDTIKVGEETGKLDAMLLSTADDYEYESSAAIKSMMSIIEPLMIVILGVVVAGVMVSVLVPMYSMYGNIDENTGAVFSWLAQTAGRFLNRF